MVLERVLSVLRDGCGNPSARQNAGCHAFRSGLFRPEGESRAVSDDVPIRFVFARKKRFLQLFPVHFERRRQSASFFADGIFASRFVFGDEDLRTVLCRPCADRPERGTFTGLSARRNSRCGRSASESRGREHRFSSVSKIELLRTDGVIETAIFEYILRK